MTYFIGPSKKLDPLEYENLSGFLEAEISLAQRRVAALKRTKERNPNWEYFDQYAEDYKTIDTLIEEWEAILWALNEDQRVLDARFYAPKQGILI